MLTTLLIVLPWVLTVVCLLFIIMKKENTATQFDDDEDYFLEDEDREVVRIAVYEDKAYWVYDNVFYQSDVTREPDFSTAEAVDTMDLPPKELHRLMNILDELKNSERE